MSRSWLPVAVKAAITLSLIGWLLHRIDLAPVFQRFGQIQLALAIAAAVVMFVQLLVTGWRWWLVGRTIGAALDRRAALRLTLIGHFFSQTLPSAIGGDAVRAWLASREGVSLGKAVASVFADRIAALLMLVALVAATLPLFHARVPDPGLRLALSGAVAATAIGMVLFFALGPRVASLLQRFRLTRPLALLANDLRAILTRPSRTAAVASLAACVHVGVVVSVWMMARALRLDVEAFDCLVLIPPIVLLTMLPISIAGWGVREGAMVVGFGFVGLSPPDALALSVAFGLIQVAIGLPGGALWLAQRRPGPVPDGPPRAVL